MDKKLMLVLLTVTVFVLNAASRLLRRRFSASTETELGAEDFMEMDASLPAVPEDMPLDERAMFGSEGERLILATARTIVAEHELTRWRSFDREFTEHCLQPTPQGLAFNRTAFEIRKSNADEELIRWGVAIYNACSKAMLQNPGSAHQNLFGIIAQVYLAALMALRDAGKDTP